MLPSLQLFKVVMQSINIDGDVCEYHLYTVNESEEKARGEAWGILAHTYKWASKQKSIEIIECFTVLREDGQPRKETNCHWTIIHHKTNGQIEYDKYMWGDNAEAGIKDNEEVVKRIILR